MRRQQPEMTSKEALVVIGVTGPELDDVKSIEDANRAIETWKDGPLKAAYRARCKARHPDLGPASEKDLREAEAAEDREEQAVGRLLDDE